MMAFSFIKNIFSVSKTMCLNPDYTFPLNLHGKFNKNVFNTVLKILNQGDVTGWDIAQELFPILIKYNIECIEVSEFYKKQKAKLFEIKQHNKDMSELYVPVCMEIKDMIYFIENYSKGLSENNYFKNLPFRTVKYFVDIESSWNDIVHISNDEFKFKELHYLEDINLITTLEKADNNLLLDKLLLSELKAIAKSLGVKVSGKKSDLIVRLLNIANIRDEIIAFKDFSEYYFINEPDDIICKLKNDLKEYVSYYKVNKHICRLITITYIKSRSACNYYNDLKYLNKKEMIICSDRCNCYRKKTNKSIEVKWKNMPPYEIGCDCDPRYSNLLL
jgi:hypothetical protein